MDIFFSQNTCSRCGKDLDIRIMSKLNEDVLCITCADAEKKHLRYSEAVDAELAQVKVGNYNYPGLLAGQKYPFGREGSEG